MGVENLLEGLNAINGSETAAKQLLALKALDELIITKIEDDERNLNQVKSQKLNEFAWL